MSQRDDDLPTTPLPAPAERAEDGDGSPPAADWQTKNRRRLELIRAMRQRELTPAERGEFERLQAEVAAGLERAFPGPPVDPARLEQLEARLSSPPSP